MHFANNIKYLRKKRGLTQTELASLVGTEHTTVGGWEKGKSKPYFGMLMALRELFGVDLESLVYRDLETELPIDKVEEGEGSYKGLIEEHLRSLDRKLDTFIGDLERASLAAEKVDGLQQRMATLEREIALLAKGK